MALSGEASQKSETLAMRRAKAILIWEEGMPTFVGFNTFAALPEEQISEKISRRILAGDQGMLVWWSIAAGVHVEPHSHANEQIVWMLKGKMEFRLGSEQRVCGPGDVVVISGRYGARGMVPRRQRGDRFLRASARGLPARRQTRLYERRLTSRWPPAALMAASSHIA